MAGFDMDTLRVPLGFEQLTVSSTSKALTATVYDVLDGDGVADLAVISVETDAIRYRCDGVAPTASVGMPQAANSTFTVYGVLSVRKLRMIRVTTDATIEVHYYRVGSR